MSTTVIALIAIAVAVGGLLVAGFLSFWNDRNNIGVVRRQKTPRISTLDLFELPESLRSTPPPVVTDEKRIVK